MIARAAIDNRLGPQALERARASTTDTTLYALVSAIAEEVAAKVKSEIAAHVQHLTVRVQPALLNVKEAAIYLGRSEQSVQHLIFEKELPVVRVGRRVHLDRRDLDTWIEKNKY
jgi:excisionase family DNA binding protein